MKIDYLGSPHVGGTHTVFVALRRGLASHGIEVRWIDFQSGAQPEFDAPMWDLERRHGDLIRGNTDNESQRAAAVIRHLQVKFDAVLINVFMSPSMMNIGRYLPPSFPRIMIVHSITRATYQAARALRDYVHATVGVSRRIRDDLISSHGFAPSKTYAIFNAVDPVSIADPNSPRPRNAVLSLGRLEDACKGILQLPKIFDREAGGLGTLSIAGDGPDRQRLEAACSAAGLQPNWLGMVPPHDVASVYAKHVLFVFPSRFEGMGLALAEAMASGLVPIAARIRDVTDTIIEDGVSGYLFDQGTCKPHAHASCNCCRTENASTGCDTLQPPAPAACSDLMTWRKHIAKYFEA